MILPGLAMRNLLGAGLRTLLNAVVLSLSFVVIIASQGLLIGMDEQSSEAMVSSIYGGGQYWQAQYDPYDPLTLDGAHDTIPVSLQGVINNGQATPILIVQGTVYPHGRFRPVQLKGIEPEQQTLAIPSHLLTAADGEVPAIIGKRMARNSGLKEGDYVTIRWRDVSGTFDACEVRIMGVFNTSVQMIDNGQLWVPLDRLRAMTGMVDEATMVVVDREFSMAGTADGWTFRDQAYLLQDIKEMVESKKVGWRIFYVILLLLAMLAIFDTQVLSIFRRRKEIGTIMALGMTRGQVIRLFTMEGAFHGVGAALVGAVYGVPLLWWLASVGWRFGDAYDEYGFAMGDTLYPVYSVGLVIGTTLLVLTVTTIVSFLPTRPISKLKPTDALRGRLS